MKRLRFETVLPLTFLLAAAFVFGFVGKDVTASSGNVNKWVASLRLLPQQIEAASENPPASVESATILPLMATYSQMAARIKEDWYGKKPVDERILTYDAIRGTLYALGDPFTRFMAPDDYKKMHEENEGNFTGIGAQLDTNQNGEIFIKEPLPGGPAENAKIKSNDVILAVNGKSIRNLEIDEVVKKIRGPKDTKVTLTLRRPKLTHTLDITIVRREVQFQMVRYRMADENNKIGYLRLYQFNEQSDVQFDKALAALEKQNMRGLILDLRGNPGGLLQIAVDIGSRFIKSGPVVYIQERGGQRNSLDVETDKHNHKMYPLAVLVDHNSASASEIISGAIKDLGLGTLVGTTTFGKGRVQTIMPLADGSAVAITTAKYLTPNGTDIHKKGIAPDIAIEAKEDWDPNNPATDVQLAKAMQVVKVKLGILPKTVLEEKKAAASVPAAK